MIPVSNAAGNLSISTVSRHTLTGGTYSLWS
nr:MAG TPA: hypothetical protein [Caudoviricetes sp.]